MNLAVDSVVLRLDRDEQLALVEEVRAVCRASPLVRPRTPGGLPMNVRVTAAGQLGWVGDGDYRYDPVDSRGDPWPALPQRWRDVADRAVGVHPWDSGIVNWYAPDASLGWHIDKAERDRTQPIVTISLGDAASWAIRDDQETCRCRLESGDVTVLVGRTRGLPHSIERVIHAPLLSPLRSAGRISVTLRVAG